MKNKKRKKTPRYVQEQRWSTTMMVEDELVDRINEWQFYYFVAATIVPLLEDFLDVAEFKVENGSPRYFRRLPEERYTDAPHGRHCSFDELRSLDKTIALCLFPTLQAFAALSVFTPKYFDNMYYYPMPDSARTDDYNFSRHWDEVLHSMVESWQWVLERKPKETEGGWEDVPEKVFYGLPLFAEYLPEMQND